MSQAPIKVNEQTKVRIRYLAALTDATQAEIVDRAVSEYAERHADEIAAGMERARAVWYARQRDLLPPIGVSRGRWAFRRSRVLIVPRIRGT